MRPIHQLFLAIYNTHKLILKNSENLRIVNLCLRIANLYPRIINLYPSKGVMQGKFIGVVYTLRTYWNLWAEFVNKNKCISVRLVSEEVKSIKFDNFDNSHSSFLWPEYFIDFFMWKMDPMSGCNIRLVSTLPPRDSTLQYKRCVHFWNNFPCITSLR